MGATYLPDEIWLEVFKFLCEDAEKASLTKNALTKNALGYSCVCRQWKAPVEPFIYRHLSFSSLNKVQQAARALEDDDASRKVSRWTRTLRFVLPGAPQSQRSAYAECATMIISRSRALVELDARFFWFPTENMIAAAVEAAIGTLSCLKLAFARDVSPALWAAINTVPHLRSLHLSAVTEDPFTEWDDLGPWDLPYLRGLTLDLNCSGYYRAEDLNAIFTFLGRCSFPDLQELEVSIRKLGSDNETPALGQFLRSHSAIIRLTANGTQSVSDYIMKHTSAETVTLSSAPTVSRLSPRIRTLRIRPALFEDSDDQLLAFLKALTVSRSLRAQVACVKLDSKGKDRMRSKILPFAHRLHELGIILLDANDEPYHV